MVGSAWASGHIHCMSGRRKERFVRARMKYALFLQALELSDFLCAGFAVIRRIQINTTCAEKDE